MNIQIYGTKKCFDTKKAERYFKERSIKIQFVDLNEKGLSQGELNSVKAKVSLKELLNPKSKEYEKLNLNQIRNDSTKEELILKNPKLLVTPIVRNGKEVTVGYAKEVWDSWE